MTAVDAARSLGLVAAGERAVLTAGTTTGVTGSTDLVRVITL
jgi:pyruvate kinase